MRSRDRRTVLERVLAVVDAVADLGPDVSLARLAAAADLPKPTALRIANDLVARDVLVRAPTGYALGAELHRLGDAARVQSSVAPLRAMLDELHQRFGGMAWISVGRKVADLRPASIVCAADLATSARAKWPPPSDPSTLTNTAGGQLLLTHRPELVAHLAARVVADDAPVAARDVRQLETILHRTRETGVATESGQVMEGWGCAAVRLPDLAGQFTLVGVTVGGARPPDDRTLRAVSRTLLALATDPAR